MAGLVALAGIAGLAAGCGSASAEERRGADLEVAAGDPAAAAAGDLAFGLALLDAWCAADPSANIVLSPASVASGLGMAALGAKGATAAEMSEALGWPADPLPDLRARTAALRATPGLKVSDQIWADPGPATERPYLDRLQTAYRAPLRLVPLLAEPEDARATINDAIAEDTDGLIEDLLPEGSLGGVPWVLTDAVHFEADWASPFEPEDTAPRPFTTASGGRVDAEFLNRSNRYGYANENGWTAVRLPYSRGTVSMVALLPDADADDTGCAIPSAEALRGLALKDEVVSLALPKTDLTTKRQLKDLLEKTGMSLPFSDTADFTGISRDAGKLAFVLHAATLRVDEEGTEAAAATAVGVEATGAAPPDQLLEVVFDRPYLLLLRDEVTGQPLFLARVADPTRH
ncbi:serpin B [Actinocorallia herbida]|uniref:Serpin B n=1 Tax=Actinocorallia herbida TaxID=58109 RepID=A0A3N1D849_9ACTN|nr:serpin family protein [Actinocorallia herbida]ROO89713.1 serpin B [Actinocorallia herbida]